MSASGINQYTAKIQTKERLVDVNDAGLIDEVKFAADYTAKNAQLRSVVEKDNNLDAAEKTELLATVDDVSAKNFAKLGGELDALDVKEKAALKAGIERLNGRAFDLLTTMQKTIEGSSAKVLDVGKISGGISRENFNRHLSLLDNKIESLAYFHREIDRMRVRHGIFEALFGRMQARYERSIATLTQEVKQEYMNLATLASLTGDRAGERKLKILSDRFGFLQSLKHEGFWTLIGERLTTREGLTKSWEALKAYTTGIVHGVLSMIDPRTYIMLVEMIGAASSSLIFCDDNWPKIQKMIAGAQQAWNQADDNGRAEMLGQFVGSILGAKGVGMATKAGKVAMLNKVKGTVLAADVGVAASGAVAKVSGAVSRVTNVVGKAVPGRVAKAGRSVVGGAGRVASAVKKGGGWTVNKVRSGAEVVSGATINIFTKSLRGITDSVKRLVRAENVNSAEVQDIMRKIKDLNKVGDVTLASAAENSAVQTELASLYKALEAGLKTSKAGILRAPYVAIVGMLESLIKGGGVAGEWAKGLLKSGKRLIGRAYSGTLEVGAEGVKRLSDGITAINNRIKRLATKFLDGAEAKEIMKQIDDLCRIDDASIAQLKNPAVQAQVAELYMNLGKALRADVTGLLRVPYTRMTKWLTILQNRGGLVGTWAGRLLESGKLLVGKAYSGALEVGTSPLKFFSRKLADANKLAKRLVRAEVVNSAEVQDLIKMIDDLNDIGELSLKSALESPVIQVQLAELYEALGAALKANKAGILRTPYVGITKLLQSVQKGGGAVSEWAGNLLKKGKDVLAIGPRLYLSTLDGVTKFAKSLVREKVIGGEKVVELMKKIESLHQVGDLSSFSAVENPLVRNGLVELQQELLNALKANKAGPLRRPYVVMTKLLQGIEQRGGEAGEWAKGLLEKGKGFVDLAQGAPGRAPVLSVSAAKVLEGLAGLMDRSGVRQYMPAFGVAQGEIGPAPQLSDAAVVGGEGKGGKVAAQSGSSPDEDKNTPPRVQLQSKGDQLKSVFKNYEKYDRKDPEKNWKAVNKAVAGLIGIASESYEQDSFMNTVKEIQTALKEEPDGTPLESDGKIGPKTMRTIGAWNVGKNDPNSKYHDIALNIDLSKVTPDSVADAKNAAKKPNGA